MFNLILYQPEIPPNTGNLIRLTANTGVQLHLVEPLGFNLSDRQLARAGLDYHDLARVMVHEDWAACCGALAGARMFAFSTHGTRRYDQVAYQAGDALLFGSETCGLPADLRAGFDADHLLRLPMCASNRSMNLANTAAVVVFEAWRQHGFAGSA